jgi:hypothetical protein
MSAGFFEETELPEIKVMAIFKLLLIKQKQCNKAPEKCNEI